VLPQVGHLGILLSFWSVLSLLLSYCFKFLIIPLSYIIFYVIINIDYTKGGILDEQRIHRH
jgi:hypothetical protein